MYQLLSIDLITDYWENSNKVFDIISCLFKIKNALQNYLQKIYNKINKFIILQNYLQDF